jgi:hypothetical protein
VTNIKTALLLQNLIFECLWLVAIKIGLQNNKGIFCIKEIPASWVENSKLILLFLLSSLFATSNTGNKTIQL